MAAHDPKSVDGTPDDWKRVSAAIDARLATLPIKKADLYKESVSETTYRNMAAGVPVKKPANRIKIARALGWTDDSIDQLLAGGAPTEAEPEPVSSGSLAEIRALVESIQRGIEVERAEAARHGAAIAQLAGGVQQLLDAMRPPNEEVRPPTNAEH